MPQVNISIGKTSQYPSQVFSPLLMADINLTLPKTISTWVPQTEWVVIRNEEVSLEAPLWAIYLVYKVHVVGLTIIDLTQETLDAESREKLKGKLKLLESKLKKEKEFHRTILANYEDEAVQDMEETRYRMHLKQYKQKIWQCKILLTHTGSIQDLKVAPPPLTSSVGPVAKPRKVSHKQGQTAC